MGIQSFGASMLGDISRSMERLSSAELELGKSIKQSYDVNANSQITKKKYSIQLQTADFLKRLELSNDFETYDDTRQQFIDGIRAEIQADTGLNKKARDELINNMLPGLDEELTTKVSFLKDHGQWTQVKVDADQWANVLGSDSSISKEDATSQYRYYYDTVGLASVPSGYGIQSPEDFERTLEAPKALQAVQNQYKEHGPDPEWNFESAFVVLSDFNLMPYEQEAVKSEAISWYRTKENERKAAVIDQTAKIEEQANKIISENGKLTRADVAVLTEGLDSKYGQAEVDTLNKLADTFADEDNMAMIQRYVETELDKNGTITKEDVQEFPMRTEKGQKALDTYIKGLETGGAFEPRSTRFAKEFLEANYYNPLITDTEWYKTVNEMVADGLIFGEDAKKAGWYTRPSHITSGNIITTTLKTVDDKVKAFGVKKESQDSVSAEVSKIVTRTVTPGMTEDEANAVLERTVAEVASGKVAEDVEDLFKKQLAPSVPEIVGNQVSSLTFGLVKSESIEKFFPWFSDKASFEATPEALKLWNSGHLDDYVDDSLFNFLVRTDMAKSVTGNPMDMLANQRYGQEYKDLNEAQKTVVASTAFVWKMQDSITETASSTFGFKNSVQVRTPMGFGVLVDDKLYVYDNSGDEGGVGYTSWFINSVSDDVAREISRDMENGNYAMPILTSSDFTGMPRQISMFQFDEKRFNSTHGGNRAMNIRKHKEIDSLNTLDLIYTELDGRKNR